MHNFPACKMLRIIARMLGQNCFLVDLQKFFFRFRVRGRKKKSSENDQKEI